MFRVASSGLSRQSLKMWLVGLSAMFVSITFIFLLSKFPVASSMEQTFLSYFFVTALTSFVGIGAFKVAMLYQSMADPLLSIAPRPEVESQRCLLSSRLCRTSIANVLEILVIPPLKGVSAGLLVLPAQNAIFHSASLDSSDKNSPASYSVNSDLGAPSCYDHISSVVMPGTVLSMIMITQAVWMYVLARQYDRNNELRPLRFCASGSLSSNALFFDSAREAEVELDEFTDESEDEAVVLSDNPDLSPGR